MKRGYTLPIIILFAIIAALALPSLLKDEEDKKSNEEIINIEDIDFSFSDNGVFFQECFLCNEGIIRYNDIMGGDKRGFTFYSFDKKSSIVLCNNIDCEHNNSDCPAIFEENLYAVYYYKDKQYIISDNSNNVMFAKIDLYEADSDGTNRQKIHKFDYYSSGGFFCRGSVIYMFATEQCEQFETDSKGNSYEVPRTIRIVTYNLDTGEVKEDIVCENAYQQFFWFLGEYKGKVYYRYQYSEKAIDALYDENGIAIDNAADDKPIEGIGCIDVNENKITTTIIEEKYINPIGYSNGKLYWYMGESGSVYSDLEEVYVYNIDSKETDVINVDVNIPESNLTVADDKLFFNYSNWHDGSGKQNGEVGYLVYDPETGKQTEYDMTECVIGEYDDYYLLTDFHIYLSKCTQVVKKDLLGDTSEYFNVLD